MKEKNRYQIQIKRESFLIVGFFLVLIAPLDLSIALLLYLLLLYLAFYLFAFKEVPTRSLTMPFKSSIATPTSSQINPFVTSSAEMRIAMEHDIQTPLTKIIGKSEMLITKHPELSYEITDIIENAHYLSTHTSHYFEYFGLGETQLRLDNTIDISDVLRTALIDHLNDFESLGITYRFDIPDTPILIRTEAQLLANAITDTLKYLFAHVENFKDVRVTIIIRKVYVEINIFIDTDQMTRESLSAWQLFGHTDTSRNLKHGLHHLSIVLANQMILKHKGLLTVNHYASKTLHYQIKLRNPNILFS